MSDYEEELLELRLDDFEDDGDFIDDATEL